MLVYLVRNVCEKSSKRSWMHLFELREEFGGGTLGCAVLEVED